MRTLAIVFAILPALVSCSHSMVSMEDAAARARQAEIDFAKAFADRDLSRFEGMIAEDAYFLGPRRTLHGKAEIMSVWSDLIRKNEFTWAPERVVATADGRLALSTGPIRDTSGKIIGQYSSIWQRQHDGSWRVIFDGPGSFCPEQ